MTARLRNKRIFHFQLSRSISLYPSQMTKRHHFGQSQNFVFGGTCLSHPIKYIRVIINFMGRIRRHPLILFTDVNDQRIL